ncbi:MAG: rhomboid family intramembrane serine protease [Casimicrobiaceae bacterium]
MHAHAPDPAFTDSAATRANFRQAALVALAFVALIVAVQLVNWAFGLELQRFGILPRQLSGLPGILEAPLLHGDFAHLLSNALPLLVAGTALLHLYPDSSRIVIPAIYIGSGVAVWLVGRDSIHIGASGLVYGFVSYVFVAGMLRRDRRALAASLLVAFMYGALVWGVLPLKVGVSWETHLAAALIGIVLAFVLRGRDVPPRRRYAWEDEEEPAEEAPRGDDEARETEDTAPPTLH